MKYRRHLYLCCCFLLSAPSNCLAGSVGQFETSVALLLREQDRTAAGKEDATALQKSMLDSISRNHSGMERVEPTSTNLRSMTEYVLSGGNPELAGDFLKPGGLPAERTRILAASAHFMRGERDAAAKLLGGVDPLRLSPGLVGRIALIQAMLLDDGDSRKLELLDIAVAAMPGTLVEESALRRFVSAAAATVSGTPRFWSRAARHLRRFSESPYGAEFVSSLIDGIIGFERREPKANWRKIELLLDELPANRRRAAYLLLARRSFAAGSADLSGFAARRAGRLSLEGSEEKSSSILFVNLYGIAGDTVDESVKQLEALGLTLLRRRDRLLLAAARSIALQIRSPMMEVAKDPGSTSEVGREPPELTAVEATAVAAVEAASRLLKDSVN